ncbi:MAG: DEAD/DEAH box helicase [Proteobacteria bacterium]|nr:DEAD/DEAH box helicase [Desulfobulbaceae bacterium]MBU4151325.1 DEAD/DEAH box helicase [Pseudomonadota bacterium]
MSTFPIEHRLLLKPWFANQTLQQAEIEMAKAQAPEIIVYRHSAAAIFADEQGWCLIKFQVAPQLSQGFRPVAAVCSRCNLTRQNGDLCSHLATLCSQVMVAVSEQILPLPLTFGSSRWAAIARFLNQHDERLSISTRPNHLHLTNNSLTMRGMLANDDLELARRLFPEKGWSVPIEVRNEHDSILQQTWRRLHQLERTDSEISLNQCGTTSQGQRLARSLWTFLCQTFCRLATSPTWRLERDHEGEFSLFADSPSHQEIFKITPSRELLLDFLQQINLFDLITKTAPARAYSKIFFSPESGDLIIEPWLELADGSRLRRESIKNTRFGRNYSLNNTIFFTVTEQGHDFNDHADSAFPLFTIAQPQNYQTLVIAATDVPDFVKKHHTFMLQGGHDLDPALLNFSLTDLPDTLEIVNYREDGNWCLLDARYGFGSNRIELTEIIRLRREGARHIAGRDTWLQIDYTPLSWMYGLGPERLESVGKRTVIRLTKREMMAITALVPEIIYPEREDFRAIIRRRITSEIPDTLLDAEIPPHLRTYQRQGLAWLHHLQDNGVGGVLADDMGLGKTHQALALLALLAKEKGFRTLVICPASVLPHWQDKAATFYSDLNLKVYYGATRSESELDSPAILLTTYGLMRQDIELIKNKHFQVVIFDEIQNLKNKQTATHQAAKQIRAEVAYGLTGTPIENSLTDLKAICDLCVPGLLGSDASFQSIYADPITSGSNTHRIDSLKRMVGPFMLRRVKEQVLTELPEVIEDIRTCELSDDQIALYRRVIDNDGHDLLSSLENSPTPVIPYMKFLAVVQELKQICNHPCQILGNTDYQNYRSGKWDLFVEILHECLDASLKVVVFSQYTKMLNIVEAYLKSEDIPYAGIRGNMALKTRRKMIDQFNNDQTTRIFCASLLAGGTGIDLTSAQVVIHYDRWWNAAREEQATARVHRMGQKHVVQVFKFISQGTMEEKIHRLINRKKDLVDDVIQTDDESFVKRLTKEDLRELLRWEQTSI